MRAVLVLASAASTGGVFADVFRWTDDAGRVHYGDRGGSAARVLDVRNPPAVAEVVKVTDGDTVVLANGEKVRFLGINAPEIESRYRPGEPGGTEARRWLHDRIGGAPVRLVSDVTRRDKYRRLLAHVFARDGGHVNVELVRLGLAVANIHPPDLAYADALLAAQQRAEREGVGIWGDSAYAPKAVADLSDRDGRGWRRLVGVPERVTHGRTFDYLVFSRRFAVRIPKENRSWFPDLSRYVGVEVEIRGWPSRRGNRYSVQVLHPSALVVRSNRRTAVP